MDLRAASWSLLMLGIGAAHADCPVTRPEQSVVDVPGTSGGWFGSEAMAVQLPPDGRWNGMGARHRYRNKLWFWRRGYEAVSEPRPDLTITGRRMDDTAVHALQPERATNATGPGWEQMLTLVEFPRAGCWEVTATYVHVDIRYNLTFVVDVAER